LRIGFDCCPLSIAVLAELGRRRGVVAVAVDDHADDRIAGQPRESGRP
ncbi:MAG: hypothetical protein K0S92_656, partial [Desertimonas sp.]|nr:hypothetical protein [Desertimonas sp.]